jgi:hypothetical protein
MKIEMVAGNTKRIHIPVEDENGNPLDQTGNRMVWGFEGVRKEVNVGTLDGFIVTLDPLDTTNLKGVYDYQGTVTDSMDNVTTVVEGKIIIKEKRV